MEFSEILPISSADRSKLIKDIDKSDDPSELLNSLLLKQWQQRVDYFGKDLANNILAYAVINTLDPLWVDHLTALDDLRDGVRLRGYAQKDPLVEYRKEGFEMFQALMRRFESNISRMLFRLEPVAAPMATQVKATEARGKIIDPNQPVDGAVDDSDVIASEAKQSLPTREPVVNTGKTLGRNDPCWCGKVNADGKPIKWKHCHYPELPPS